ncbi:RNase A-like domain-containing protein, partial [Gracilibacillus saliphilus]|uniref:RNase A-like domain-containing protein n=1 Tax=Gracilibacillus saliphilus TaxID=543890 RepID=UPI00307D3887
TKQQVKELSAEQLRAVQEFANRLNRFNPFPQTMQPAMNGAGNVRLVDEQIYRFGDNVGDVGRSGDGFGRIGSKGIDNVKQGDKSFLAPGGGLATHEAKGGHLIERHVGKSDDELLERIKNNPRINGSSTFKDRAVAEKVASKVLSDIDNKKAIESWLSNPQSKSTLVLTYEGTEVIGRGVKRGSTTIKNMTNARIVLKKDRDGNYILTGYPN